MIRNATAHRALQLVLVLLGAASVRSEESLMPAPEAARRLSLPEGFHATLFAAEPEVRQPISFAIDERGRLWVAECYSYPEWTWTGEDRIVIFEDADGDGRADRRRVFWEGGTRVTGVEIGFGGAWVCATPNLLFIPDRDGDDRPDAEPEVVLDGWDPNGKHNLFNGLTWGPEGWLYGLNGILSISRVGPPGVPAGERPAMDCGVWRYHPARRRFEAVAWGTTNPWGLDFDERGELFITNCVIPHLFHVVPGAHFIRMFGQDLNPYVYGLVGSCADHIHWAGGAWQDSRGGKGKHGEAGGGHAHAGAMVYLGDNWPERYRGTIFTCNIHGRRVNNDVLERRGSGFVATHGKDFLFAADEWFRGLELQYGPDGGVFLTDWSDAGECHESDAHGAHRESGRIFKITHGEVRPVAVDLRRRSDAELVELQRHRNEWYPRRARLLLQERAAAGADLSGPRAVLRAMFEKPGDTTLRLRALWTLHATGGAGEDLLLAALGDGEPDVRGWAVRLLCDGKDASAAAAARLAALAREEPSPRVRLSLSSALGRLDGGRRLAVAAGLAAREEDAADEVLPLMTWYGIEPLVAAGEAGAVDLAGRARLPLLRRFIARRAAARGDAGALVKLLLEARDPRVELDLLAGMGEGLRGAKLAGPLEGWSEASARLAASSDPEVRERALEVGLLFGDPAAAAALRVLARDRAAPPEKRAAALGRLAESRVPGLAPELLGFLGDPGVRGAALRALANTDDAATPAAILERYAAFNDADRRDALSTLSSRREYARALLDAVEKGVVPRRDVSAFTARQILAFDDEGLTTALRRLWGELRPAAQEKAALVAKYRALLRPEELRAADRPAGRLVFERACLSCHRLFDAGTAVGPDLTGSQRANLDYVLENVLDPSAAVARDYKMTIVVTKDGRLISGITEERSERTLRLRTATESVVVAVADIAGESPSEVSMMPENLFDGLTEKEVRDLVAYLGSEAQVPLPGRAR